MTLQEQYEQRKMVLDAVAIEARKVIEATETSGLEVGCKQVEMEAAGHEWHVNIQVNTLQAFVSITGHVHRNQDQSIFEGGGLIMLFGGGDRMDFDFNCPIDWVPRADLP